MAGGFDGIEVTLLLSGDASLHTAQASLIEVKCKESTHSVDNLYKYLKIKKYLLWIH